jgi:hypothetical protein
MRFIPYAVAIADAVLLALYVSQGVPAIPLFLAFSFGFLAYSLLPR